MQAKKYINHTLEEIEEYLKELKLNITTKKFHVCTNREKNKKFITQYNINTKKQKEMLLALEATDFCYSVDNERNLCERLYVFSREYQLNEWGETKNVQVYIKVTLKKQEDTYTVVISFHELEKCIKKLFN